MECFIVGVKADAAEAARCQVLGKRSSLRFANLKCLTQSLRSSLAREKSFRSDLKGEDIHQAAQRGLVGAARHFLRQEPSRVHKQEGQGSGP